MPNHIKPSVEELKEKELEIIAEAEKLQDVPPEIVPEDEPVVELEEETPKEPEEEVIEEQAEPSEEEKERLKKKLSASARENQKIYAKNRVINRALEEADELPEPTEEELEKEFKDWEIMSETERRFAKETIISRNWRSKISEAKEQATKIERWNDSIEEFVDDPKTLINNPELEGRVEAFKEFASQEENNSVPMKILVSAFLHENSKGRISNKGSMFEKGNGGPNSVPTPKSDKLSIEEGRKLRETNYGKWKELLAQGKIASDF